MAARIITKRSALRTGLEDARVDSAGMDAAMRQTIGQEAVRRKTFAGLGGGLSAYIQPIGSSGDSAKTVVHGDGSPGGFGAFVGSVKRHIQNLVGPSEPNTSAIDAQISQRKRTNQDLQNNRTMRKYGI